MQMMVKPRNLARIALAAACSAGLLLVGGGSASAGTCSTQGCGGEVSNNSRMNIRIANNWCWGSLHSNVYYGDKLPCVDNPGSWWEYRADVELPPGDWSGNHYYYYDTDAIRFYRDCVTKYHFWGTGTYTEDRRGKSSKWLKIYSFDHVYVDSITC